MTAHYDSVPQGPGAYDNMAGAAIIMEICRYFKEHTPGRTLEFIWFGAEEKGLLGSRNYVQVHEGELKNHRFNMNVDLAGQLVGGNVIGVTGDSSICSMITYLAKRNRHWNDYKKPDLGKRLQYFCMEGDSCYDIKSGRFWHAHPL